MSWRAAVAYGLVGLLAAAVIWSLLSLAIDATFASWLTLAVYWVASLGLLLRIRRARRS